MYKLIVAGGTFDLLHRGHKSFLNQILNQTDHLILGLTTDQYVSSNKEGNIDNYETRKKNLEEFLFKNKEKAEIVPIDDIYGPLLEINPDVIAVTEETQNSVEKINNKRQELGLPDLKSLIVEMDRAEDGGLISSSRIRRGEIDRDGNLYFKKEWTTVNFRLPESLREELSRPFGEVLEKIPDTIDSSKTITVGDVTTKNFNQRDLRQLLSIVDLKVHREKKFNSIQELGFEENIKVYKVKNSSGMITHDLFEEVRKIIISKQTAVILVDGEDDLGVIPYLIFAPLGFTIFYGQPSRGLIRVEVTEENKKRASDLLEQFIKE